jgi:hypothetical protein
MNSSKEKSSLFGSTINLGTNREETMNKFKGDIVSLTWEGFSKIIEQNYLQGKGTIVPTFGTFTFISPIVNLKGTTNERDRDIKLRHPVFVMSRSFCEIAKPGIFVNGNMLPFKQTFIDSIPHIKFSFADLTLRLSISKSETENILTNCLKYISESILKVTVID